MAIEVSVQHIVHGGRGDLNSGPDTTARPFTETRWANAPEERSIRTDRQRREMIARIQELLDNQHPRQPTNRIGMEGVGPTSFRSKIETEIQIGNRNPNRKSGRKIGSNNALQRRKQLNLREFPVNLLISLQISPTTVMICFTISFIYTIHISMVTSCFIGF